MFLNKPSDGSERENLVVVELQISGSLPESLAPCIAMEKKYL